MVGSLLVHWQQWDLVRSPRRSNMIQSVDYNFTGSWSNQAGPYQYYIHGSGAISKYLSTSADYKNPAANDALGLELTIDSTAKWNSDMLRTELIPQMTATINKGKVFYHFSIMHQATNPPSANEEHQITFL
jgi:hypothetical protein